VRLEFKLPPGGNNGLAIRYPGQGNAAYDAMCELQVLDDNYEVNKSKLTGKPVTIDPRQAHGSAYGMVPAARGYQRPLGEWNYQEVTVNGSTLKVELNSTATSRRSPRRWATSPIPARTGRRATSGSRATATPSSSATSPSEP